jgi:hypothetical protein
MNTYYIYTDLLDQIVSIYRTADRAFIPQNPENMDYAAYLAWVAEGNTAQEWTPEI